MKWLLARGSALAPTGLPQRVGDDVSTPVLFPFGAVPFRFDVDRQQRCIFFEMMGEFSDEELFRLSDGVVAHPDFDPSFARLVDLARVTRFAPSRASLRARARLDGDTPRLVPGVMIALVANQELQSSLRAYVEAMATSPVYVRMFGDGAQARCWLGLDAGAFERARSIMIVESHAASRVGLASLLVTEGFEIIAVANGGAAIAAFGRRPSDVVLLEHVLPDMDAEVLLTTLSEKRPSTHFVLVTGAVGLNDDGRHASIDELWPRYERAGAAAYLPKPVVIEDLLATIERVTEG